MRGKKDFKVTSLRISNFAGSKMNELFIPGVKSWDNQKVYNSFQSCDVKAILATSIPGNQVCDRVACVPATDGIYSVKQGTNFGD